MSLAVRLAEIRRSFENGTTPPETIQVLNAHVETLVASKVHEQALSVGDTAPMDQRIEVDADRQTLDQQMGSNFLILTWFRGNW